MRRRLWGALIKLELLVRLDNQIDDALTSQQTCSNPFQATTLHFLSVLSPRQSLHLLELRIDVR